MTAIDPNELFAFLRVCQDPAVATRLRDKLKQRLDAIQTSRLGPQAVARQSVHIQPSDETTAGGSRAEPLAGPNPGWSGGGDLGALAASNRKREEAQKASFRGPGPAAVHVSVGPVPDDQKRASVEITKEIDHKTQEANKIHQPASPVAPGVVVPPPPIGTPTTPTRAVGAGTAPVGHPAPTVAPAGQNRPSQAVQTPPAAHTAAESSKGEGKAAAAAARATAPKA
jgi:hypothetical protein